MVRYSPILNMSLMGTKRDVSSTSYIHLSRVSRPTVPGGSESAVFGYAHKAFSSIFLTNSYLSLGGYKQMTMTGLLNLDVEKAEAAYPSLAWQWATGLPGKNQLPTYKPQMRAEGSHLFSALTDNARPYYLPS